jgi:dihydrofolate reductase
MPARYRIVGYAIASADGMIADAQGVMPDSLKIEADHQFLDRELDRVDGLVHGRRSHEGQSNSHRRRRLVLTRRVETTAPHPEHRRCLLWNPEGASFEAAFGELGVDAGTIAILGGTDVYDMFLDIGYDAFYLCCAGAARIAGGTPVFSQVRSGRAPADILSQAGLTPGPTQNLDEANALTLVAWTRAPLG